MTRTGDSGRKDTRTVLAHIVQQHFDEAADGWLRRGVAITSHVKLSAIDRSDRRIAANLAGLVVAETAGTALCEAAMASATSHSVFVTTAWALQTRRASFDWLVSVTDANQKLRPGLLAGLSWTERAHLQGVIARLLAAEDPVRRAIGVSACAAHGVDPGLVSRKLVLENHPQVRTAAVQAAGELGFVEALPFCASVLTDDDPECRFWAAWATLLLGGRGRAMESIVEHAVTGGPRRPIALTLAVQANTNVAAHELLQEISKVTGPGRWIIQGSGLAGEPAYVPWLLEQMAGAAGARAAGEAFALITGVDFDQQRLWTTRPQGFESGPNDDPDDPNVDIDPDEGLPWPDVKKVEAWWQANQHRFQKGTRYFMGQPVTKERCIHVLKTGYQRQRILAAQHLCLLEPGTPLFNTSAPAWRQQRLLAAM